MKINVNSQEDGRSINRVTSDGQLVGGEDNHHHQQQEEQEGRIRVGELGHDIIMVGGGLWGWWETAEKCRES